MWTKVDLDQTSQLFQSKINEYLNKNKYAELLKVIEVRDGNDKLYKYTGYMLNGNLCITISQWLDLMDGNHFTHDSMIIGEILEFLMCEQFKHWLTYK